MKPQLIPAADVDRLDTWQKYRKGLCDSCRATCWSSVEDPNRTKAPRFAALCFVSSPM